MNRENMTKLLQWLEAGAPHAHFNMAVGFIPDLPPNYYQDHDIPPDSCKTACCLAGAAVLLSDISAKLSPPTWSSRYGEVSFNLVEETARNWLGLGHRTAAELFEPDHKDYQEITLGEAIQAVKNLLNQEPFIWEE